MSTGPAERILFRSPVAAVNYTSHLRVYTQDVGGSIREGLYEGKWGNGNGGNAIATGKIGGPIAATSINLDEIRVYYVDSENRLREQAYSSSKGWYAGDLNKSNFVVAPYSRIGASFLAISNSLQLRVYAQLPNNTIQEFGYDDAKIGWKKMTSLGLALPGTALASTSYRTSQLHIRLYYQNANLGLVEKAYDGSVGWYNGAFSIPAALPRTSIAAVSFPNSNNISLRIYYAVANDKVSEKGFDGTSWYDGGFNQPSIPGTEVAAITWGTGSGLNIRVYFQYGHYVSAVSEWVYSGGKWSAGVAAIPPA